jgi:hypothetical protein
VIRLIERCTLLIAAACLLVSASCARPHPALKYSLQVSDTLPRQVTINLLLTNWAGPYLDLRGRSPSDVMQVEGLDIRDREGRPLRWVERADTIRGGRAPIRLTTYRILGPIPPKIAVRYHVSVGRHEGDAHIGFTGRCFGYLGPEFGMVTGRDIFLLPEGAESLRRIEVGFSLPAGWRPETPWRQAHNAWIVDAGRGSAAEHLGASTIGLGRFREQTFSVGRTRVCLAFVEPVADAAAVKRTEQAVRSATTYIREVFGRDIGPEYTVLIAPETPDGCDIAGGGWASGQGRTLVPVSTERLRKFAEELIQVYVRYPPYRTEIHRPDEFWLVDAIRGYYSRRAVARAGLGDDEGVARGLALNYLTTVTTDGMTRDLEGSYGSGESDRAARESITPFLALELDHELRTKHASAQGIDAIIPHLMSGRSAPSLWSLLPNSNPGEWDEFHRYARGTVFAPAPDLFTVTPTRDAPIPAGGAPAEHLTLAYTGNTEGYLENCGCKLNQSGGIARRATILDSIRSVDPHVLIVDAGGTFDQPGLYEAPNALAELEQRFYLEMMDRVGYSAAAVGLGELSRGSAYFQRQTKDLRTPFLTANVSAGGAPLGPASTRLAWKGHSITLIGAFEPPRGGKSQLNFDKELAKLTIGDPVEAIEREVRSAPARSDLLVVLGRLSPLTIRRLIAACPDVDVVISTDGSIPQWKPDAPKDHPVILQEDRAGFVGRTLVLYTTMGQYGLSVAHIDLDREGQIVGAKERDSWLTDAVPDQRDVRRAIERFYDRVGALPAAQASVRPPLAADPYWQGKRYVGSKACKECHEAEYAQWDETPHSEAYKTLLDKHRHYQPVCLSCHVVGFGSEHGYKVGQPEAPFGDVQCEVCHGPGAGHVADPENRSAIRREVPEHVCLECHNEDHSDRFRYTEKLPLVLHRPPERVSIR